MKLSDFDYSLPKELIAQEGLPNREDARLMVLNPDGQWKHDFVKNLTHIFRSGDFLILNDTRVIESKLMGRKETGGKVDCLILPQNHHSRTAVKSKNSNDERIREVLLRGHINVGMTMHFPQTDNTKEKEILNAKVMEKLDGAKFKAEFDRPGLIQSFAKIPLPPYIKKPLGQPERYQTVYSKKKGSLAAPTAGLHFTPEIISKLKKSGVDLSFLTLHIGMSTFAPIRTENVEEWKLDPEYYEISEETALRINEAIKHKRRLFVVGTTSIRALESSFSNGTVQSGSGWTDIFIYPGYQFRFPYSGMLTNFHLPKSTLLLLVSAFSGNSNGDSLLGRDKILNAYREAVKEKYRFYSLGDAMLILK